MEPRVLYILGMMVFHAPLSVTMILIGVFGILRPIARVRHAAPPVTGRAVAIVWLLWPIGGIIGTVAGARFLLPSVNAAHVMAAATLTMTLVFAALRRIPAREVLRCARRAFSLTLFLLVFGIYVMKGAFEATGAAEVLPGHLAALGIPTPITVFAVPMTIGLLTGYSMAATSTAFPLLAGLLGTSPVYVLLALSGGFTGLILSPVHLCLALSRDYFNASWGRVYRRLVVFAALQAGCIFLYCWIFS